MIEHRARRCGNRRSNLAGDLLAQLLCPAAQLVEDLADLSERFGEVVHKEGRDEVAHGPQHFLEGVQLRNNQLFQRVGHILSKRVTDRAKKQPELSQEAADRRECVFERRHDPGHDLLDPVAEDKPNCGERAHDRHDREDYRGQAKEDRGDRCNCTLHRSQPSRQRRADPHELPNHEEHRADCSGHAGKDNAEREQLGVDLCHAVGKLGNPLGQLLGKVPKSSLEDRVAQALNR